MNKYLAIILFILCFHFLNAQIAPFENNTGFDFPIKIELINNQHLTYVSYSTHTSVQPQEHNIKLKKINLNNLQYKEFQIQNTDSIFFVVGFTHDNDKFYLLAMPNNYQYDTTEYFTVLELDSNLHLIEVHSILLNEYLTSVASIYKINETDFVVKGRVNAFNPFNVFIIDSLNTINEKYALNNQMGIPILKWHDNYYYNYEAEIQVLDSSFQELSTIMLTDSAVEYKFLNQFIKNDKFYTNLIEKHTQADVFKVYEYDIENNLFSSIFEKEFMKDTAYNSYYEGFDFLYDEYMYAGLNLNKDCYNGFNYDCATHIYISSFSKNNGVNWEYTFGNDAGYTLTNIIALPDSGCLGFFVKNDTNANTLNNADLYYIKFDKFGNTDSTYLDGLTEWTSISNLLPLNFYLQVYPNPAQDYIEIFSEENNLSIQIEIYDALGKQILLTEFKNKKKIDVKQFQKGAYFYLVKTNNQIIKTGKFIKN